MGLFSGIKKAFKSVFKGIGKAFDKLLPESFKSFLADNKWVGYALTAVAVVSGGIAVANGITQGVAAFKGAAAQATLTEKLGQAAVAFGKGAWTGFTKPVETGKNLLGMGEAAAGGQAGVISDSVAKNAAKQASQAMDAGDAAVQSAMRGKPGAQAAVQQAAQQAPGVAKTAMDAGDAAMRATQMGGKAAPQAGGFSLKDLASKAWNAANSPAGQAAANFGTNYFAQKAALQEAEDERRRRDAMWRDFAQRRERDYRPTPPPNGLRAASDLVRSRAAAAQQRYA